MIYSAYLSTAKYSPTTTTRQIWKQSSSACTCCSFAEDLSCRISECKDCMRLPNSMAVLRRRSHVCRSPQCISCIYSLSRSWWHQLLLCSPGLQAADGNSLALGAEAQDKQEVKEVGLRAVSRILSRAAEGCSIQPLVPPSPLREGQYCRWKLSSSVLLLVAEAARLHQPTNQKLKHKLLLQEQAIPKVAARRAEEAKRLLQLSLEQYSSLPRKLPPQTEQGVVRQRSNEQRMPLALSYSWIRCLYSQLCRRKQNVGHSKEHDHEERPKEEVAEKDDLLPFSLFVHSIVAHLLRMS